MNHRLNELHLQRGRLLERIASQRVQLSQESQPAYAFLFKADRVLDSVHAAAYYVKQNSGIFMLAAAGLFFVNKGRVWRLAKKTFFAWQAFQAVREKLFMFGSRPHP